MADQEESLEEMLRRLLACYRTVRVVGIEIKAHTHALRGQHGQVVSRSDSLMDTITLTLTGVRFPPAGERDITTDPDSLPPEPKKLP